MIINLNKQYAKFYTFVITAIDALLADHNMELEGAPINEKVLRAVINEWGDTHVGIEFRQPPILWNTVMGYIAEKTSNMASVHHGLPAEVEKERIARKLMVSCMELLAEEGEQ